MTMTHFLQTWSELNTLYSILLTSDNFVNMVSQLIELSPLGAGLRDAVVRIVDPTTAGEAVEILARIGALVHGSDNFAG